EALYRAFGAGIDAQKGRIEEADAGLSAASALLVSNGGRRASAVIGLLRGLIDLARARQAAARGDFDDANRFRDEAYARVHSAHELGPADVDHPQGTPSLAQRFAHVRLALRVVEAALEHDELAVEHGGHWFRPPAGHRVDCGRRQSIRKILVCLAEHR